MDNKSNLVDILKSVPAGVTLYHVIYGSVEFNGVDMSDEEYPISFRVPYTGIYQSLTADGREYQNYNGECVLFPSKENRDWAKYKVPVQRFNYKTLQPFDRVLVRDFKNTEWKGQFYSHYRHDLKYPFKVLGDYGYRYCIPYNDETKHLMLTTMEAPEFYRTED